MAKDTHNLYSSPLVERNASREMSSLFSPRTRIVTWRRLWLALAEAQHKLGLEITKKQLAQMRRALEDIDFKRAARYEKSLRHDVMAHVHTFGDAAPAAKPIIHLGATSAFIVDNADLIIMRQAMVLIRSWLVNLIDALGRFAKLHRRLPTLGFTHFQPAQLTTVGKRATLWCYEFIMDLERLEYELAQLKFRGVKGATGTQASYLELFDDNTKKVEQLEQMVARAMGFSACYAVVGQTYSRKVDAFASNTLAGIASSAHKFANDMRLLCHLREIEEPFGKSQIGSSAMAYKRNPMRSERATALARLILSLQSSPAHNAAEQWFERTLDDSANKRISVPELFLACDGMLRVLLDVARGLVVNKPVIASNVRRELPFMATENILMAAVQQGGNRQDLHERIRRHSQEAAETLKQGCKDNDLMERLSLDPAFATLELDSMLKPEQYTGLADAQCDAFIRDLVTPIRRKFKNDLGRDVNICV